MNEKRKTVAVIGAGIVGVATAIRLQRDGHKVVLIDPNRAGEGASFGNGGVLASSSIIPISMPGLPMKAPGMLLDKNQPLFLKWSYLPKLTPWLIRFLGNCNKAAVERRAAAMALLVSDSLSEHQSLAKGTGAEKWIVPSDYLFLYDNRFHFESDSFAWSLRRRHGIAWEILEGPAFRAYDPIFAKAPQFAVRLPGHGIVTDPGRYLKDLADHAVAGGARMIHTEASEIVGENGKVSGVRAGGETIACDAAIVAAGIWSKPLATKLGVNVPIESERGYHVELWEPSVMPRSPVMVASRRFVAAPMDGRIRLAGVVEFGGLDAPPNRTAFDLLLRNIRAVLPNLTWKRQTEWMGHRPSVADSLPVIGEVPKMRGAFFGFGHDHVGLTAGPRTGRLLAQLISGYSPNINLAPFSPKRFE